MDTNKPIKRSEFLLPLSRDHHFSLLFSWKIKQGLRHQVDNQRIQKYVAHFWQTHMLQHFQEEEELLFTHHADDLVARAVAEHGVIKNLIEEILKPGYSDANEKLKALAEMVDDHVRYEERILFPHLERELPDDIKKAIASQLNQNHSNENPDNYPDEFWKK